MGIYGNDSQQDNQNALYGPGSSAPLGTEQGYARDQYGTLFGGSSWQMPSYQLAESAVGKDYMGKYDPIDMRSYMYGRNPYAADEAVNRAFTTGDAAATMGQGAAQAGENIYNTRMGDALAFDKRAIQQGDFGTQNATLAQLGAIDATQGPSGAQAQLQAGTNQALASQLALARSGHGFGGNAAAMGQAQGNVAGIQAAQANNSAMLAAQEEANRRARLAANLGTVAGAQGQQVGTNLNAYYQGQGQNDTMVGNMTGLGQQAYFQGQGLGQQGYQTSLAGQGIANQIRGQEMQGGANYEDRVLRAWAAQNGYNLAAQQQQDQKNAGYINAGASLLGSLL